MDPKRFAPFTELSLSVWSAIDESGDGAHDHSHLLRVWQNAKQIQTAEGGDLELLAAAVLLHDCVHVPKNSTDRSRASRLAADKARLLLGSLNWTPGRIEIVAHAILSHSYSAGIEPTSLEGRILQDADRLDAIGYTGIARCFYTAGRMASQLYEPADPAGVGRELDDCRYALDHFPKKLLRLAEGFLTNTGQSLARERQDVLLQFYRGMLAEIY